MRTYALCPAGYHKGGASHLLEVMVKGDCSLSCGWERWGRCRIEHRVPCSLRVPCACYLGRPCSGWNLPQLGHSEGEPLMGSGLDTRHQNEREKPRSLPRSLQQQDSESAVRYCRVLCPHPPVVGTAGAVHSGLSLVDRLGPTRPKVWMLLQPRSGSPELCIFLARCSWKPEPPCPQLQTRHS